MKKIDRKVKYFYMIPLRKGLLKDIRTINWNCLIKLLLVREYMGYILLFILGKKNEKVLVVEKDSEAFGRATYINQARVHMGYHYPRSYSTAKKSANYFDRFVSDFPECIHDDFKQIYATSSAFSWTNREQFKKFCKDTMIKCEELPANNYFNEELCDGALF